MNDVQGLHSQSMAFAERAFMAKLEGNIDESARLVRQAFEFEQRAAHMLASQLELEPSRSVIHRSAASLAIDCNEYREAERLISTALSGHPPSDIAEELRDLLEEVSFHRHLELRGLVLAEDELQFSIAGSAVGPGMAVLEPFLRRVQAVEKLLLRTAERISGRQFRERGPVRRVIRDDLELFLSAPRTGSMTVSFKVGSPKEQLVLPSLSRASEVIDELMASLQAFSESHEEGLRDRISNRSYYANFVGLARAVAPDGDQIKQVGFTRIWHTTEKRVALTKPSDQYGISAGEGAQPSAEKVSVEGRLLWASSLGPAEGKIKLKDDKGRSHTVIVPEGMMADIVRPLWEYQVLVTGFRQDNAIRLEDINKVSS